ncbi:prephenate dehydratase [filamentous cyanobacterium LEGE 11480]|uniref:Prephenate dehydratase n=2 Tax=Romeriopsis TaxID=2992131 RepID=A0A928VKL6_9CYAN|nr:prephenate dehydratase [Romeriopsis navalis LEGE 11480]
MSQTIAHLGPVGTYTEAAALICQAWLTQNDVSNQYQLKPYPSIALTLEAVARGEVPLAIVPVENSLQGGVTMTMDTLWRLDQLQIHAALVMPIQHALLSHATSLEQIKQVYSHPQALGQCPLWLAENLPQAELIPANSTTEGIQYLSNPTIAAISSQRAAQLYGETVVACPINDHQDNCTRFLLISREAAPGGCFTSLALSLKANQPGSLLQLLQAFADRGINLSRIESRPSKRSMGDYLFFLDMEGDTRDPLAQAALSDLKSNSEMLKVFGSYDLLPDEFVRSVL